MQEIKVESIRIFLSKFSPTAPNSEVVSVKSPKRKNELEASKKLIDTVLPGEQLTRDKFGKPFLASGNYYISISHSKDCMAISYCNERNHGIDLQHHTEKILKIKSKFVNNEEQEFIVENELKYLHLIWGAKEAAFKYFGSELDFKRDITIQPFTPENRLLFKGKVQRKGKEYEFVFHAKIIDDMYLVCGFCDNFL